MRLNGRGEIPLRVMYVDLIVIFSIFATKRVAMFIIVFSVASVLWVKLEGGGIVSTLQEAPFIGWNVATFTIIAVSMILPTCGKVGTKVYFVSSLVLILAGVTIPIILMVIAVLGKILLIAVSIILTTILVGLLFFGISLYLEAKYGE